MSDAQVIERSVLIESIEHAVGRVNSRMFREGKAQFGPSEIDKLRKFAKTSKRVLIGETVRPVGPTICGCPLYAAGLVSTKDGELWEEKHHAFALSFDLFALGHLEAHHASVINTGGIVAEVIE